MSIKLIIDSGCDLSEELMNEYDVDRVSLMVLDEETNEEYLDKITITEKELYKKMRTGKKYKTAQALLGILEEKFEKYAKKNMNVIFLCLSSGLSGMYQSLSIVESNLMDKYPEFKLDIVDSKAAASGSALMAIKVGKMIQEGKKREEILETLYKYIENIEHIITVEEMSFLYSGGRISRVQALAGGLLNIKPIIDIDNEGKLRFIDKVRGQKKLISRIIEIIEEKSEGADLTKQIIGISHGDNLETVEKLKELIDKKFNPKEIYIQPIGASVVAHTGPSVLGVTFLSKNDE